MNTPYWTVYILKCENNYYYTGCTSNLEQRLTFHENGKVKSTKSRLPFILVWSCNYPEKHKAYFFEKYLKSGSGIAFRNKRLI